MDNFSPLSNEASAIFGDLVMATKGDPARQIFEDAGDVGSIDDFAKKQLRSLAMACVLEWIAGGDYTYQALDDAVVTVADLDGDGEILEDEESYFNELLVEAAYALTSLGADMDNVQSFIEDENDEEGQKLGEFLSEKMNDIESDDETLISNYAVSNAPIMEAAIKVVRGGKIVLKKKRIGRPRKLSAAQKAALKKARRKAFTGAAKLARKKSMKMRMKRGL